MYCKEQGFCSRTCLPGGDFSCQTKRALCLPLYPLNSMEGVLCGISAPYGFIKNNFFVYPG